MSNKPRPWPNLMRRYRDQAAEEAARGIRTLTPVVDGRKEFTETERLRRESIVLSALHKILFWMRSAGAENVDDVE